MASIAGWVLPQQGYCLIAMPGPTMSSGAAQASIARSASYVPGPLNTSRKPCSCSNTLVVGRETRLRQPRREQAVAGAVPDVHRLGHRAEIRLDARRERGGERERDGVLRASRPHQMAHAAAAAPNTPSVAVGCQPLV